MPGMLDALEKGGAESFREARLNFEGLSVCGTPRRLVLHVADLAERQNPHREEVLGPPITAAFDQDGNPTKAAIGFARTNGVDVFGLERRDTPKGERLIVLKEDMGKLAAEILGFDVLFNIVCHLPSPKSMRWGCGKFSFVRPIHWVLALYGGDKIEFTRVNQQRGTGEEEIPPFGNTTRGHRFMANTSIVIKGYSDYLKKLREHFVEPIVDDGEGGGRISLVRRGVGELAANAGAELAASMESAERLIEKVVHLLEWPSPVLCGFNKRFLDLPEQVIVTALEEHQRCFALRKKGGGPLVAKFIGVSNTVVRNMDVVIQGYERVVRARLEDAEFYWKQDLKTPLEKMVEKLKGVIYHPRLGTSWEKVERFRALACWIAVKLFPGNKILLRQVNETARFCKADLSSGMVYEFPELQGLMGSQYAIRSGMDPEVSKAIYEHYLPRGEGDAFPSSKVGSVVGLADRIDTLVGMIGLGYVPSGSEDPYALRRAANSAIQLLLRGSFRVSLAELAEQTLGPLVDKFKDDKEEVSNRLMEFLRNRVSAAFSRKGMRTDLVEAVLSANAGRGWHDPVDANARLDSIERMASSAETFEPLATTFKRVSNIIRKATVDNPHLGDTHAFSKNLLEDEGEYALDKAVLRCSKEVEEVMSLFRTLPHDREGGLKEAYIKVFEKIAALRPAVDRFFNEVLVMAHDEKLRANRLALLGRVGALFAPIVDFSKIQGRPKV